MSLRVWLPLTKDLRNQGLDDVTVTNNGATFNSAGKLGGCYEFASGKRIQTTLPASTSLNAKAISFACWMYVTSWNSSYDCFMSIADGTGWVQSRATLCRNNTASTLTWNIADGTNRAYVTTTTALSLNTWTHIAGTYDGANLKIYINGVLNNTSATTLSIGYAGTFNIGGWSGNNYPFNGRLNDVRIYNHCLSPMEVKELAKGLVLHYPLDRQGWGQENLLPCGGTYIKTSPWTTTLNRTDGYAWVTNSAFEGTPGETYTVSVECDGNLYSSHGGTHNATDKHWTFWLYVCNTDTTKSWSTGSYDAAINLNSNNNNYRKIGNTHVWTVTLSNTQKYISVRTNSYSDGSTNLTINWWNMKIEKGNQFTGWCPNNSSTLATTMGLNSTTEYDCSGLCNNGTRTGTFIWTSDTPKYAVSTTINSSKIQCITNPITGEDPIFSIGFWFKLKSNISYIAYADLVSFSSSSYSNQPFRLEICGNPVGNDIYWFRGPSGNAGGFKINTSSLVRDTWYHTVLVSEGSKQYSYYINGIKTGTYNGSANSWIPTNIFSIGDGQVGAFDISDVRIYATALSADDVKSLYQNCATIDPDGTIRGQIRS